jgi:hypothetical protein
VIVSDFEGRVFLLAPLIDPVTDGGIFDPSYDECDILQEMEEENCLTISGILD